MKSTIKLFKALPIWKRGSGKATKTLLEATIKRGFIFSPEVIHNYKEVELLEMVNVVEEEVGLTKNKMNSSFHKSWAKVRDASMEKLVMEQIVHYFTTYGFSNMGIYSDDSIYIPNEALDIPELEIDKLKLVNIKGYTKKELKEKMLFLLGSGIALGEDTKDCIVDVALFVDIDENDIEKVRNKEVKATLYEYMGMIPKNPTEFLRYCIYRSTNKTLLIKNKMSIDEIKESDNIGVAALFKKYEMEHGLKHLAEIFYRFKPLFLAFRTNTRMKSYTNKIRKLAIDYHKPMKEDYMNTITARICRGEKIVDKDLKEGLKNVNIFRKTRLAYALRYRTKDVDSILYRIRNGKGYSTSFVFTNRDEAGRVLEKVTDSIVDDMKKNVKGKKIYIPDNIRYTLPATEKQFTGDIPSGSYISVPKDMLVGIHWFNTNKTVDLDLSMINMRVGKIGWDSSYRTDDRSILFSGDITSAPKPNGASELFYVKKQEDAAFILMLNYYNYDNGDSAPFKIMVARKELESLSQNYMVNPNNVECVANTKIDEKQKVLGLLVTDPDECRFYFTDVNMGKSITSSGKKYVEDTRKYLYNFYTDTISLNGILVKAGAKMVTDKNKCDIDLSLESLEKDKIIKLMI